MLAVGSDVTEFFPDVVKNVASTSLEVRKLVYIYLLRNSHTEQELALLSVNTFQKDLSDPNQAIRSLAVRVLSGIQIPVISPIVLRAVEKSVMDMSPAVRASTAFAISKLYT
jgi:AP-3 complex subunit beta